MSAARPSSPCRANADGLVVPRSCRPWLSDRLLTKAAGHYSGHMTCVRDGWTPLPRLHDPDRIAGELERRDLDGLVLTSPQDIFYLTSFWPAGNHADELSASIVVLARSRPDQPILITPDLHLGQVAYQDTWVADVRAFRPSTLSQRDLPFEKQRGLEHYLPATAAGAPWIRTVGDTYADGVADAVGRCFADLGLGAASKIGVDDLRTGRLLTELGMSTVDAYWLMMELRSVKTDFELDLLRKATVINQTAQEQMAKKWEPGLTWRETLDFFVEQANEMGGFATPELVRGVSSPSLPALSSAYEGGQSLNSFTGAEPDFELKPGTNMLMDMHGTYNAYCWDGGKTWRVGELVPEGAARRRFEVAAEALVEMNAACTPGAAPGDVQAVARNVLRKSGIPQADDALIFFHGLGLSHSDLNMEDADWRMLTGAVVSTHLYIPGDMDERVWVEDVVVVGDDGGDGMFTWDYIDWT